MTAIWEQGQDYESEEKKKSFKKWGLEFFGKKSEMIENMKEKGHIFAWSCDLGPEFGGAKRFGSCKDYATFERKFEDVPVTKRWFYEILLDGTVFSEAYDIEFEVFDGKVLTRKELDKLEEVKFEEFLEKRKNFFEYCGFPIEHKFYITNSSISTKEKTKISFHPVNHLLKWNTETFKTIYKHMKDYEEFSGDYEKGVPDYSIAGNDRSMRLIHNTKSVGEPRYFKRSMWNENSKESKNDADFVITLPRGGKLLKVNEFLKNRKLRTEKKEKKFDPVDRDECFETSELVVKSVKEYLEKMCPGDFGEIGDCDSEGRYSIQRTRAGKCPVDDDPLKEHHTSCSGSGAYYFCIGKKVYLCCWRKCRNYLTDKPSVRLMKEPFYKDEVKESSAEKKIRMAELKKQREEITVDDRRNLTANMKVKMKKIKTYEDWIERADVLGICSQMMTGKTQAMPTLYKKYKKILMITFRRSLAEEFEYEFSRKRDDDFHLYTEPEVRKSDGTIRADRLICQIDSLRKVRGSFDLLIIDELTYTQDYMTDEFMKHKRHVYDALETYCKETPKILVCDALLEDQYMEYFKNLGRSCFVVENTWKSCEGRELKHIYTKAETQSFIVKSVIEDKNKVCIPTNDTKFANCVANDLIRKNPKLKIALIIQEKNPDNYYKEHKLIQPKFIPSSDWKYFDVVIYSPTISAGVSCTDLHFDKVICYFDQSSCGVEICAQMTFRVRCTKESTLYCCISNSKIFSDSPDRKVILDELKSKQNCLVKHNLSIHPITEKIVMDKYLSMYLSAESRKRRGKCNFRQTYDTIIHSMGIEISVDWDEFKISTESTIEISKTNKEIKEDLVEQKVENIMESKELDEEGFEKIMKKRERTPEEEMSVIKYEMANLYSMDISKLSNDAEIVKDLYDKMDIFRNIQEVMGDAKEVNEDLIKKVNMGQQKLKLDKTSVSLISQELKWKRLLLGFELLILLGFKSIGSEEKVEREDLLMMKCLSDRGDDISTLFKKKWEYDYEKIRNEDDVTPKMRRAYTSLYNHIFKKLWGVSLKRCGKEKLDLKIAGLEVWKKYSLIET